MINLSERAAVDCKFRFNHHLAKAASLETSMTANDTCYEINRDNTDFRYFIYAVTYTVILVPGLIGNILACGYFMVI